MDNLWAPWRIKYVQGKINKKCIFCAGKNSAKKDFVLFKTDYSITILNIYPYNNGHLMVAPLRHVKELKQLNDAELLDLFRTVQKVKELLEKVLKPAGFNVGINFSEVAGAGIPGHLHVHIVPRWKGDTNFMPVLADTKVISQSVDELYKQLKKGLHRF